MGKLARLEPKHWLLIAGFLTATASVIGGLDHWEDLWKPPVVAGLLAQIGVLIGAVFAGAPPNPHLNEVVNPGRRIDDPTPPSSNIGTVSEATRRNLL